MKPTPTQRSAEARKACTSLGLILALFFASCSEQSPEEAQGQEAGVEKDPNTPFTFRVASIREQEAYQQRELQFDPTNDGWNSETFHGDTTAQLKALAESLSLNSPPAILSPRASSTVLRPENLVSIFDNGGMKILRGSAPATKKALPLTGQLQNLTRPLIDIGDNVSIRFKQFRVLPPANGTTTCSSTVLYKARASSPARDLIQNATWVIDWIYDSASATYLIEAIHSDNFEEVELLNSPDLASSGKGQSLFSDRTADLIERLPRGGLIHWGANELSVRGLYQTGRGLIGLALGDANGDGIDDIYMPQSRDLPNMLLLSKTDGSLEEVAANSGLNWLDETTVALFADFDNDGDQDLVVGTRERMAIHENTDGSGMNFKRVLDFPQADTSSLAAADYDGDGLLDLYVCNYLSSVGNETVTLSDAVYNALDGGANRLYRNRGNFKFDDVTESTGMNADATRLSLAASWEDFDNDNDVDLYVANDFGPNALYLNNGGRFTQVAAEMGADDPSFGMSITWGDINRDGFMDACISNMFSAAGNRITTQPRFEKDLAEGLEVERIAYLARGNTLLVSKDGTTFDEQSAQAGMVNTQWTWGTLFADFDNNGDLDLMAMNGYVTGPTVDDL